LLNVNRLHNSNENCGVKLTATRDLDIITTTFSKKKVVGNKVNLTN